MYIFSLIFTSYSCTYTFQRVNYLLSDTYKNGNCSYYQFKFLRLMTIVDICVLFVVTATLMLALTVF